MALIKCPECGKEISDKAATCPNCGTPIAGKKVKVYFHRKKAFGGSANTGTVIVDGVTVGSASNGAEFDVMLSIGSHNIVIESNTNGLLAAGRSSSTTLDIPSDAKSVDVEIKLKNDVGSFFGGGGMAIVIGEVNIQR